MSVMMYSIFMNVILISQNVKPEMGGQSSTVSQSTIDMLTDYANCDYNNRMIIIITRLFTSDNY